ncbi:FAD-binding oxidoreductase [Alcanivorax sp. DP30]|uniref:NAD(P)/FAD-dependent oxidoreductase n=1 Tax=Alcanivorax sp. DP30 TaxID=2606217 RepID=UPI00136C136C|nr:FAD-dependent oxidoreductase [Alcanivorax sp. DP30]MZR61364.1 FAD-dependent oxidoreductase [Alcanivorax sp. DP30]
MSDVLVVGGGIVGLLSALELTQRQRSVVVIDAPDAFPPASWAGGGILTPLFSWRYSDAMTRLAVDALPRFERLLKRLDPCGDSSRTLLNRGGVWVSAREKEIDEALAWAERWQVAAERRSAGSLMTDFNAEAGVFFPAQGNIRNPGLLKLLRHELQRRGVRFEFAHVVDVQRCSKGVQVCAKDGRRWLSSQVLLSSGVGMQSLLEKLGVSLPLFPAKGEMLLYKLEPGQVPAVMLTEEGYLIPRNDGAVLVGSTLRKGDASFYPTVQGRYRLEAIAKALWPSLSRYKPSFHWAGVRPGCERDFPFLGPLPGLQGVFAAAGHYRNGLVSAPASAELLAQMMCGDVPFTDPDVYSVPASSRSNSSFFNR